MSLPDSALQTALAGFQAALAQPQQTQARLLQHIIQTNADSDFGRRHGFRHIRDYADFAARVPVRDYEDFAEDIAAVAAGRQGVLTCERVTLFEETGGSCGGAKLIPYTPSLLTAFRRAVLPWLADLQHQRPHAFAGRLFFVISPAGRRATHTTGGIPIGSGDDLAYFGPAVGPALAARTLFQPELLTADSAAAWQWQCARLLLQADDLSLVSLWSPTLLLAVLDTLQTEARSLLPTLPPPRQAVVRAALRRDRLDTRALWPQLDTISCWSSHTAAAPAAHLQALFPHVWLQGKGLLATEAVSTVPFSGSPQPLLAINSHVYEFIDEEGRCHLPHQLHPGQHYRLVVTTQGGLYRYDTGDVVSVHGFAGPHAAVPQLSFSGRHGLDSDLCGEKLTEAFVYRALAALDPRLPEQALLQGMAHARPPYYRLLLPPDSPCLGPDLAARVDAALAHNPQYALARRIGQLGGLRLHILPHPHRYATTLARSDQRLGTRKIPLLLPISTEAA